MPKSTRNKIIAIACEDGSTAIMQTFADVIIDAEVRRASLPSPPVAWREIDEAEAKRIRDARPKPQRSALPIDGHGAAMTVLMAALDDARKDIEALRQDNEQLRADIIGWGKTELAKAGQK